MRCIGEVPEAQLNVSHGACSGPRRGTMDKPFYKVVIAGAGNVGFHAAMTLALIIRQNVDNPWWIAVVDFDRVEAKDVAKGYHPSLIGRFKAEATVEFVRMVYGNETAEKFFSVIAAAQSAPGLFRGVGAVFNGTDSARDAAFVSEASGNSLEIRMTTGMFGLVPVHCIEVMPRGYTLGVYSYDSAAWADAGQEECQFGLPINSFAGVAQPFGSLSACHAVQAFLCQEHEENQRPYIIRISGTKITRSDLSGKEKGCTGDG